MVTGIEVFKTIKAISQRTLKPDPRILLSDLATELSISQDSLLVLLVELENRGLVNIYKTPVVSVSLTNYGANEENPPGGFES